MFLGEERGEFVITVDQNMFSCVEEGLVLKKCGINPNSLMFWLCSMEEQSRGIEFFAECWMLELRHSIYWQI